MTRKDVTDSAGQQNSWLRVKLIRNVSSGWFLAKVKPHLLQVCCPSLLPTFHTPMAEGPHVPASCPQAVGVPGVWDGLKKLVYKVAETLPWTEHSSS